MAITEQLRLINLPDDILKKIMYNFSYHQIAKMRCVCRRFDDLNKELLNEGCRWLVYYIKIFRHHIQLFSPRSTLRSENPSHKHIEILDSMDRNMRLLLELYRGYMQLNILCFMHGKVIDEGIRMLRILKSTDTLERDVYYYTYPFYEIVAQARDHMTDIIVPPLVRGYRNVKPFISRNNSFDNPNVSIQLPQPDARQSKGRNNLSNDQNRNGILITTQVEIHNSLDNTKIDDDLSLPMNNSTINGNDSLPVILTNPSLQQVNYRVKRNKTQISKVRSLLRVHTQEMNNLKIRLEELERQAQCPIDKVEKKNVVGFFKKFIFGKNERLNNYGIYKGQRRVSKSELNEKRKINSVLTFIHLTAFVFQFYYGYRRCL